MRGHYGKRGKKGGEQVVEVNQGKERKKERTEREKSIIRPDRWGKREWIGPIVSVKERNKK